MSETKRERCWCCGEVHEETDREKIARLRKRNDALTAKLLDVTGRLANRMKADLEPDRPRKLTAVLRDVPSSTWSDRICTESFLEWFFVAIGKTIEITVQSDGAYVCNDYCIKAEWLEPGSIREVWEPQEGEAVVFRVANDLRMGKYVDANHCEMLTLAGDWRTVTADEIRPIEEAQA